MTVSTADADTLEQQFLAGTEALRVAVGASGGVSQDGDPDAPATRVAALQQLFEVMRRVEHDAAGGAALEAAEIAELGDYGFSLLEDLSNQAMQRGLVEDARALFGLSVPLALWVVRRGGHLQEIQMVVNALAELANRTRDPQALGELAGGMDEIIQGVAAAVAEDPDRPDPMRPWRILLLNYGIVATRSHQSPRIDRAYEALVTHLPEEAPGFLREAMGQMEALDYPAEVRAVVGRWFRMWGGDATRH
jgi:hypothetical protein